MKKITLTLLALLALIGVGLNQAGITPAYLAQAPGVATGMGAKLACSSKYVSHLSEAQAKRDLISYSPLLAQLDLVFNDAERSVVASFFGFHASASHRDGLGCAIDFDGVTARNAVVVPPLNQVAGLWPLGDSVLPMQPAAQAALEQLMAQDNAAGLDTRALVLVKDNQIIAESYAQGIRPDSQLLGWSMGKSVTAIAIGRLIYEGKLTLDDVALFPQWRADERSNISVHQMLTMTDGLDFEEIYAPGHDVTRMLFTEPSAADYALSRPAAHTPGRRFNYSSGTANLLSKLVQVHSGGSLQTNVNYLDEHVYRPLGLTHALFESDSAGNLVGSSYLYASARDWAKIGLLMLNQGEINGQRLLSQAFVALAATPNGSANEKAYGFQFWLNAGDAQLRWANIPKDAYAAMGNRSQIVMIIPSAGLVFVRLGWTEGHYPTDSNVSALIGALDNL